MKDSNVASKVLFEIDTNVNAIVKKIELLSYVNPINMEEEKAKFFNSKYLADPKFKYPVIDFDRFQLHRQLISQPIEEIENEYTRELYEDTIYAYSGLIQCIQTIGFIVHTRNIPSVKLIHSIEKTKKWSELENRGFDAEIQSKLQNVTNT